MVKHTQTIRRQIDDKLFECVWSFVNMALKGLKDSFNGIFWTLHYLDAQNFVLIG